MTQTPSSLLAHALAVPSLTQQLCEADAVIWFGSGAAGVADAFSDVDLLVVGRGVSQRVDGLDVVFVDPSSASAWMAGTELASHVQRWGRLLCGDVRWMKAAPPSAAAVARKERKLLALTKALDSYWDLLSGQDLHDLLRKVRRDLQRWDELRRGEGPSPRPILDERWRTSAQGGLVRDLLAERAPSSSLLRFDGPLP